MPGLSSAAMAEDGADFPAYQHSHRVRGKSSGAAIRWQASAKAFTDIPVIACGKLEDSAKAEAMLAEGEADLIAIARGAIGDPSWPSKLAHGRRRYHSIRT